MDDWTLLVVLLLGSIMVLTALVTIIVRCRLKGSVTIVVASILGIFAGVAGASHGPGEILQGNIAPTGIIIEAWPALTLLAGEPATTLIPSFSVSGIATVILGLIVTIWTAIRIQSENGGLVLILLSTMMFFVGGGLLPPVFGVVAGIIGARVKQKDLKTSRQKG
ncbi:MAG: hypothetical protein M3251_02425 [Thermoproteota archaeon]|nr:hypothetical protein [Thermoproteota archaeon]